MYSTQLFHLLLAALSIFAVAQALMVDAEIVGRSDEMIRRQQSDDKNGLAVSVSVGPSATTSDKPSATTTPKSTQSSTPPASTTTTPSSATPSATPSSTPSNTPTPTTSSDPDKPTTPPTQTTSSPDTSSSSTSQAPSTSTFIFTTTASDGSPSVMTSLSTSTPAASLAPQSNGSTSGMSTQTRNILIGVFVGVGGAIALAVLGFVAWRIWGRKKNADEQDDLMQYGGGYTNANETKSDAGTSSATGTGRSPFQSTLESYHAPTQVNTASNF